MAHEIFGERFYGHRTPAWHNLGFVTQEGLSGQDALIGLGGGYWFDKVPNYVYENEELVFAGDFKIRRSPTPDDAEYRYFGNVTDRYNIIQPLEIVEMFDKYVQEPVETLGMLGKGERLFLTWKLNNYNVNGFAHTMNAFLAVGYDAKYGATLNVVDTRVVCSNTWRMAIAETERKYKKSQGGYGRVWRGKHNSPNIKRDLGIWMEHIQSQAERDAEFVQQQMQTLASTSISKDEVYKLLFTIYPNQKPLPVNYPEKLRAEKQERIDNLNRYAENDRELVMSLFGGAGTGIDGNNLYDAFNAVTEYEDWGRMTKKNADLSIVMGNRANTKQHAMSVFYQYAVAE